jgi:hypothetical protein
MFDRHSNVGEDPPRDFDLDAATLGCEQWRASWDTMGQQLLAHFYGQSFTLYHIISCK